ncbi:MAG TPA: META domain-containing protein [Acidimicrobiales bacterium]|nr:META domain-containing protein [Acidimicrobiales bacterium]
MRRRPTGVKLLLVLLVLALAAGCGDDDDVSTGDAPEGPALAAEYLSIDVTEDGRPRELVPGSRIRLTFSDGQVGASLGCNQLGGRYRLDGDVLVVDELFTTDMGCDPRRHAQDGWFADLLGGRPTLAVAGDDLTITRGSTVVTFRDREVADPDRELVGTTWEVDGFLDVDTAMSMAPPAAPGTLVLREDGWVTGSDGCNSIGYSDTDDPEGIRHRVAGDRITFEGDPVSTLQACEGGEDYVERYREVLSGTVTWSIEADRLTLTTDSGQGVTYRATG